MPLEDGKEGKEIDVHLEPLEIGSTEYQDVLNKFTNTGGKGEIISIERIQNPLLYKHYVVQKEYVDKENPGKDNEKTLFHGTDEESIGNINKKGFNRSYCGKNGEKYHIKRNILLMFQTIII